MVAFEKKIQNLGYKIPDFIKPKYNYLPYVEFGGVVFFSGQLPWVDQSRVITGEIGNNLNIELGKKAAINCVLSFLSVYKNFFKDFDRIERIVKITGYINGQVSFVRQAEILDAASKFLIEIFGLKIGSHSRTAVGVNSLPRNSAVEIEFILGLKNQSS